MSINMPQLIFQRAESAPLSSGQSISSLGEGGLLLGGGGESQISHPLYETLHTYIHTYIHTLVYIKYDIIILVL